MDFRQAVMKPDGDLIRRISLVCHPEPHVVEQRGHFRMHEMRGNADIQFGLAVVPCPFPDIPKHLGVQLS